MVDPPSPAEVTIERRIEFSDTDASTLYHFTSAFRLFEQAEFLLLSRLGMDEVKGNLPRVHASAEYRRGLHLGDRVEVTCRVENVGRTSLTYRLEIRHRGELCVEGTMVGVFSRPWADDDRSALTSSGRQRPELLTEGDLAPR